MFFLVKGYVFLLLCMLGEFWLDAGRADGRRWQHPQKHKAEDKRVGIPHHITEKILDNPAGRAEAPGLA